MKRLLASLVLVLALLALWRFWPSQEGEEGTDDGSVAGEGPTSDGSAPQAPVAASESEDAAAVGKRSTDGLAEAAAERAEEMPPADFEMVLREAQPLDGPREGGHEHRLGTWLGSLEPSPAEWGLAGSLEAQPLRVDLRLPDGRAVQMVFERGRAIDSRRSVYSGRLEGEAFSQALLSAVGEAVVGTLRIPSEGVAWEIRNKGAGVQEFEKVDLSALKGCAACRRE